MGMQKNLQGFGCCCPVNNFLHACTFTVLDFNHVLFTYHKSWGKKHMSLFIYTLILETTVSILLLCFPQRNCCFI